MLAHKRWILRLVVLVLLPLVLAGLAIFVVDPLQHYRRATLYRPLWPRTNQRYYNPGFIKHYDYDCIIIGSSMVENFIPSEVGKKMSMKVLLAPLSGGGLYEECVLLNTALRTGKVKAVIWGLDFPSFGGGTRRLAYGPGSFPFYLYDDNPLNDYQYLLNSDVLLKDARSALTANLRGSKRRAFDLDSAHFWGDLSVFSRETTLATWRKKRLEHPVQGRTGKSALDSMKRNFEVNVVPLVERNPEVTYYFFYPPYSALMWTSSADVLETLLELKRHIYWRTRALPNVRLFDFQDISDITLNLDNYKDWTHYSPEVNKFIIDAISRNEYLVTDDNIEEKISRLEGQVRGFSDTLDTEEHKR